MSLITKNGEIVSVIKPYCGFGIDDHQIRGLMRFIEMTSRELGNEDDVQVAGVLVTNDGRAGLKKV